jgi:hypothetical protein
MITFYDLYNRICADTARVLKNNPNQTDIKFYIYIDKVSYHEILRDIKNKTDTLNLTSVWDPKTKLFMNHRMFIVETISFHFNIVQVL